jgi:hypothetical protein
MANLIYFNEGESVGLAIAKAKIDVGDSYVKFSDLVSRDPRVPPRDQTVVGFEIDENYNPDYVGARVWEPTTFGKKQLGVALIPRMMTGPGEWIDMCYAHGFQGFDETSGVYFSGVHRYIGYDKEAMFLISASQNGEKEELESVLGSFFGNTGVESMGFDDRETKYLNDGHQKLMDLLEKHPVLDWGGFLGSVLISSQILGKISQVNVHTVRGEGF